MTNKELADIMFPGVTKTISDYEEMFPKRELPQGAMVTRFAPSPTGFVHMGSLLTSFVARKLATETKGIFILRIEDTDIERTVENGIQGIIDDLSCFEINIDEGVISQTEEIGNYGPYIQTHRKEIYQAFAKYLIENDKAYPCFCKSEEIEQIRTMQEKTKLRIGYYGPYARCRNLSNEDRAKKIIAGEPYVVRLKSTGNFDRKVLVDDLVRGKIYYPENDIDHVLIKSDGIPVYHFAHVVDDHLMRTTHVLRGEEWLPSTPIHIELFKAFGFEMPKFAHVGLVMKVDENGSRRKLSKRLDKESAVSYYHKTGIPVEAVKLYLMTIANSNFEAFLDSNPDKNYDDFNFDFKKMSISGSLFDLEKLLNISRNYISRLKASEVYDFVYKWALEFDNEFATILNNNKEYAVSLFNIEREQKKPRKDFANFSEIKTQLWYMFDELFTTSEHNYEYQTINDKEEINRILSLYISKYYDENLDKESWFNSMKDLADELGYAKEVKDYKENPENYKGHVGDICTVIRVSLTTRSMTPDLYEIIKLLGRERIEKRIDLLK